MAIEIKEYLNATFVECQDYRNDVCSKPINLTESAQFSNRVAPHSLMVEIEGLHSILTRNNTKYSDQAMKRSEKYWTYPYERPVIMHHNESDGITIGRVKNAYWTDVETRSGTGALRFNTNIAHKDGIEGVNNGTLSTVSVGLIAHDVTCSICGKQVELDEDGVPLCGHIRGTTVNDKLCYWNINEFEPKELSFVIVPSDPYAHILNVEEVGGNNKKQDLSESTKSNKEVNKNMHGLFDDLINEANEAIGLSESAKEETSKAKKKDEEAKEDETKKEETKESTESKEADEKEKKEDDNIDNNSSESKEQEENNEEKKDEKDEQKASEEGEGHTESKSDENVEDKKEESTEEKTEDKKEEETEEKADESKPEEKPQGKVIEEDFQKDIDSKKGDIYKDMEMQKKLHDAEMKNKDSEIKDLKRRVAELESKLTTEVKLKESIEGELIKFKTEKKQQLAEQVNHLREQMNVAPEDMKNLMESSEETLHFTIKTLKEMSANSNILNSIQKTKSEVAINENKDNTQKTSSIDVKESSESSNINVEESLIEDILSQAFNSNSYQNFY